jgi:hypothetical protein
MRRLSSWRWLSNSSYTAAHRPQVCSGGRLVSPESLLENRNDAMADSEAQSPMMQADARGFEGWTPTLFL